MEYQRYIYGVRALQHFQRNAAWVSESKSNSRYYPGLQEAGMCEAYYGHVPK